MKIQSSGLSYFGGKFYLINKILPFPKHNAYFEIFGGGGNLLINKVKSKEECYNDINRVLVNYWNQVKNNHNELIELGRFDLMSRSIFNKYKKEIDNNFNFTTKDAYYYTYLNANSFASKNSDFNGLRGKRGNILINRLQYLKQIHKRIKNVNFENCDYSKLLKRLLKNRDRSDVLIYLDPPYLQGGDQYQEGVGGVKWNGSDFDILKDLLLQFKKAMIIVSIDDPKYLPWKRQTIIRKNSVSSQNGKKLTESKEYVFRNYDRKKKQVMSDCESLLNYL